MNRSIPLHTTLALLTLTSLALAQTAPTAKPAAAPAGVATTRLEPHSIAMTVTGLTKANQAKVEQDLKALGTPIYACAACKHEQSSPGKCPTCKSDLVAGKHEALASVTVAQESATVTVTPAVGGSVRLSELENVLARNSVQLDESRLSLPGRALLVLKGGVAENAAAVEKALQTAKLFEEVHARFDPARQELDVEVRAGTLAPSRASVAKAIEEAGTKARLTDVQWGLAHRKT